MTIRKEKPKNKVTSTPTAPAQAKPVQLGFEREWIVLPLDRILPMKKITQAMRHSPKYLAIMASIIEVGIIEPPAEPDP